MMAFTSWVLKAVLKRSTALSVSRSTAEVTNALLPLTWERVCTILSLCLLVKRGGSIVGRLLSGASFMRTPGHGGTDYSHGERCQRSALISRRVRERKYR